jgi:hypothetical protein
MNLRTELIRVAKQNPNLRADILPLLSKTAKAQTTHMESKDKPGYTMCGEGVKYHPKDGIVESVKDTTCYYCKQAWENSHDKSRKAGFDYEVKTVFLSLIPKKGNTPVNVDTIKDIQSQWVDVEGKGAVNASVVSTNTSRGYFTNAEEKMGAKNETIVTLSVPVEAKAPLLKDIAQALSKFTVQILPTYRDPVTIKPRADSGKIPSGLPRRFR